MITALLVGNTSLRLVEVSSSKDTLPYERSSYEFEQGKGMNSGSKRSLSLGICLLKMHFTDFI